MPANVLTERINNILLEDKENQVGTVIFLCTIQMNITYNLINFKLYIALELFSNAADHH